MCDEMGDIKKGLKAAIKYCRRHGILKEFLEKNAREVLSMLYAEWNLEDAIAYARKEAREDAWDECSKQEKLTTARKSLAKGLTPELIQEITGLDLEIINGLVN